MHPVKPIETPENLARKKTAGCARSVLALQGEYCRGRRSENSRVIMRTPRLMPTGQINVNNVAPCPYFLRMNYMYLRVEVHRFLKLGLRAGHVIIDFLAEEIARTSHIRFNSMIIDDLNALGWSSFLR